MFAQILVPLDGSELSEKALAMAQNLASASGTSLHLLQVISLQPELDARRGIGGESVTVLEMAQDAARRLIEVQTARGKEYLEGLAVQLRRAGIHVTTVIREGAADENIVEYATGREIPADKLALREVVHLKSEGPRYGALRIAKLQHGARPQLHPGDPVGRPRS